MTEVVVISDHTQDMQVEKFKRMLDTPHVFARGPQAAMAVVTPLVVCCIKYLESVPVCFHRHY